MCHPMIGWACFTEAWHVSFGDWLGFFLQRLCVCHLVGGWACFTRAGLETGAQWLIRSFSKGQKVHHAMICWDCSTRTGSVYSDMLGLLLTTRTGSVLQ